MGKLDTLGRAVGANTRESLGADRARVDPPAPAARGPAGGSRFDGVTRLANAARIGVDKIRPDTDQPREEFDPESLGRLADSMKSRGQIQPVRVRWDGGGYVLIAGERRWRAAILAGIAAIDAIIHDGDPDPTERITIQLVENAQRDGLKPIEQAKAYRRIIDRNGWTTTRVAEELSISQPQVVRTLKMLELPEEVQEQVEQGSLPPATAYEISKLDRPEDQVEVADQVVAGKIRRSDVEKIVKDKKAGRGESTAARRRAQFVSGDDTWTLIGPSVAAGKDAIEVSVCRLLEQVRRDG